MPSITLAAAETPYRVEQVVSGLGIIWGMVFVDDHQLLLTERHGELKLLDTRDDSLSPVSGFPPVFAKGQGGLLDVASERAYRAGDWLYFTYSKNRQGRGVTTLARAKLQSRQLVNFEDLLVTQSATRTTRHFGSRIAFDGRGHVFFTVGDRGQRPNGQDLGNHAGTVLRLNSDGTVPADNPFVGNDKALPEIWSYGHRNPQGLVYDRSHQRLWLIEHGPRGGDEINLIIKGKNYGWPVVSHGKEYTAPFYVGEAREKPGMENPRKIYTPSIAPGSLLLYSGKAFPQWQGSLFSGALKLTHLNRVAVTPAGKLGEEQRLLEDLSERIRALVQSPEGWIYFSTDSGKVFRLVPE